MTESNKEHIEELRYNYKAIRIKVMQNGKCVAVTYLYQWLEDNEIEETFGIRMKLDIIRSMVFTGRYYGGGGAAAEYELVAL